VTTAANDIDPRSHFEHEAMLYRGPGEFVERAGSFIEEGASRDEAVLVVVGASKLDLLRSSLRPIPPHVAFSDMDTVGRNPARLIAVWREFADARHAQGRGFRGIGEPIFPSRSRDELVECERHEALLNLAFHEGPAWRLACPYDEEALPPSVIQEARRNHPLVDAGDHVETSTEFRGLDDIAAPFAAGLDEPTPPVTDWLGFGLTGLGEVRTLIRRHAAHAGVRTDRIDDAVLAANEIAANAVEHGSRRARVRCWVTERSFICEVTDSGRFDAPLAGRERPSTLQGAGSGFGLWLANQLCDLVQIRSLADGSIVRLHIHRV
jgi:anti-sigma regulatory factor (Ser/Thr protein kinase)